MYITNVEKVAEGPEGCTCACTCTCVCPSYPEMFTIGYHNAADLCDTRLYSLLIGG